MRDARTRSAESPWLVIAVGFVLALLAVLLLRSPSAPASFSGWLESSTLRVAATPRAVVPVAAPTAAPLPPLNGRVGLQVGHWRSAELPDELAALRAQTGASSAGVDEVAINLAVAQQVAVLLQARGLTVDLLPATIPPGYRADLVVAIHCDANGDPAMHGYKLARGIDSAIPARDDALLAAIATAYGSATGQRRDPLVTRAMTGYYAFRSQDFTHAIAADTPAVIIELGFITNPADRQLLTVDQMTVARGLADGITRFLSAR